MSENMTARDVVLLQSLQSSPKAFHMGRTPVWAIQAGWDLAQRKLVKIEDGSISITAAGRRALAGEEGRRG